MMECLHRNGFTAAAMSGTVLESAHEVEPTLWLCDTGAKTEIIVPKSVPAEERGSPVMELVLTA